jgi:hypothetical protein
VAEKRLLLAGAKADVDAYLDRWRKAAVNRVCEAFELVKETEMEKFGEKSYSYRKANGLPPADADDDPNPVNGTRAHGFEELEEEEEEEEEKEEEEENADASGDEPMELDTDGR